MDSVSSFPRRRTSCLMAYDRQALAGTLDANLMDTLEHGMAQKFEYTLEQCWKAAKVYLKEMGGLDEASPKKTIEAFYQKGHLSEEDYGALMQPR